MRSELTSDGCHVRTSAGRLVPVSDASADKCGIPEHLLSLARRAPGSCGERPSCIPDKLWCTLYEYQRRSVCMVVNRFHGRCLLAHDMGLGKTMQAVAVMHHYGGPVLVLCPAFLRCNWEHELCTWGVLDAHVQSYDSLRTRAPPARSWSLVVCDESHYLKQRDAQRTKAALPLLHESDHVLLLSGTPCPNRPEELFVPMHALRPSLVQTFEWFARRYCNARRTRFSAFDTSGSSRRGELAWFLRRAFMIRLRKQDVLHDLPSKTCSVHYVRSSSEAAMVRLAELSEELDNCEVAVRQKALVGEMFRWTCAAKRESVVSYVLERAHQSPVLAFAHHRETLDALEAACRRQNLRVERIDGSTPLAGRQAVVDRVQAGDSVDVCCFSMGAAGVGLTLTALHRVVFMELPWNPALLRQCEDRVYRIGQKNNCFIEYLLCKDTLDDHVWKRIESKERMFGTLCAHAPTHAPHTASD